MATIAPAVSANAKGQQGSAMASWMGLVEGYINNPGGTFHSLQFVLADGVTNTVKLTSDVQNVVEFGGFGDYLTTSIHINPGTGLLSPNTICELSVQRTGDQAFGSNYGRVSLSCLGTNYSNLDGMYAEYGGTVIPFGFQFVLGYEDPPGVFTSYEYLRLQYSGVAEAATVGSVSFGATTTVPFNQVCLNMASIGSAGTRDSNALLWEGKANNGTERAVWWRQRINVTTQAGASKFLWQQNLNGAGWTTYMTLTDLGALSIPAAMTVQNGAVGAPGLTFTSDTVTGVYLPAVGSVALTASGTEIFRASSTGICKFSAAGSFSANGAVTTAMSFVGPTGANASIQEWLTIKNNAGTTRYIPCF